MTTLAKAAAVAGSLASAAAVAVALILPVHHAPRRGRRDCRAHRDRRYHEGERRQPGSHCPATSAPRPGQPRLRPAQGGSAGHRVRRHRVRHGNRVRTVAPGSTGTGGGTVHPVIPSFPASARDHRHRGPEPDRHHRRTGRPLPAGLCLAAGVRRRLACVAPATRSQAAADNAVAVSRAQPGGGSYGQYTCVQGYVWRQVVPDDYTCVTPAIRAQAAADNSQAASRVALLSMWVTDWTPPSAHADLLGRRVLDDRGRLGWP